MCVYVSWTKLDEPFFRLNRGKEMDFQTNLTLRWQIIFSFIHNIYTLERSLNFSHGQIIWISTELLIESYLYEKFSCITTENRWIHENREKYGPSIAHMVVCLVYKEDELRIFTHQIIHIFNDSCDMFIHRTELS